MAFRPLAQLMHFAHMYLYMCTIRWFDKKRQSIYFSTSNESDPVKGLYKHKVFYLCHGGRTVFDNVDKVAYSYV